MDTPEKPPRGPGISISCIPAFSVVGCRDGIAQQKVWYALLADGHASLCRSGDSHCHPASNTPTATRKRKQAGTAPRQFDVVSIKENVNRRAGAAVSDLRDAGPPALTNVSLRTLIQVAYQVQPRQLVGEPDWVNNSRFDLLATTSASASVAEMRMMLRPLLEDRFGLVVHTETREVPVYARHLRAVMES